MCKDLTEYYVKASIERVNSSKAAETSIDQENPEKYIF